MFVTWGGHGGGLGGFGGFTSELSLLNQGLQGTSFGASAGFYTRSFSSGFSYAPFVGLGGFGWGGFSSFSPAPFARFGSVDYFKNRFSQSSPVEVSEHVSGEADVAATDSVERPVLENSDAKESEKTPKKTASKADRAEKERSEESSEAEPHSEAKAIHRRRESDVASDRSGRRRDAEPNLTTTATADPVAPTTASAAPVAPALAHPQPVVGPPPPVVAKAEPETTVAPPVASPAPTSKHEEVASAAPAPATQRQRYRTLREKRAHEPMKKIRSVASDNPLLKKLKGTAPDDVGTKPFDGFQTRGLASGPRTTVDLGSSLASVERPAESPEKSESSEQPYTGSTEALNDAAILKTVRAGRVLVDWEPATATYERIEGMTRVKASEATDSSAIWMMVAQGNKDNLNAIIKKLNKAHFDRRQYRLEVGHVGAEIVEPSLKESMDGNNFSNIDHTNSNQVKIVLNNPGLWEFKNKKITNVLVIMLIPKDSQFNRSDLLVPYLTSKGFEALGDGTVISK